MNKQEKVTFIQNFMDAVQDELLRYIDSVPENWDGFELRWWIADAFKMEQIDYGDKRSHHARRRRYNNDIAVNDL